MKKLIILSIILAVAVGYVAISYAAPPAAKGTTGGFNAGMENPYAKIPADVNSFTKDYVIMVPVIRGILDTTGSASRTISFMVPEAAELIAAYALSSNASATADTVTNYHQCLIFSCDTSTTDTAMIWTTLHKTDSSGNLRAQIPTPFIATTTVTKRDFNTNECGRIVYTRGGTVTGLIPELSIYMVFRPKSYPASSDFINRQ